MPTLPRADTSNMKAFQVYVAVASWYDGDTFHGVVDQGIGIFRGGGMTVVAQQVLLATIRCRCALIQAPELHAPGGPEALEYAKAVAPPGIYPCWTYKSDDTFDRPKIDLILPSGHLFSEMMLSNQQAVPYRG